jgi:hypothetical protein
MVFAYDIALAGGGLAEALLRGSLYAADPEAAKRYVETLTAPGVEPRPGLEVVLHDNRGNEIWRCPYSPRNAS